MAGGTVGCANRRCQSRGTASRPSESLWDIHTLPRNLLDIHNSTVGMRKPESHFRLLRNSVGKSSSGNVAHDVSSLTGNEKQTAP